MPQLSTPNLAVEWGYQLPSSGGVGGVMQVIKVQRACKLKEFGIVPSVADLAHLYGFIARVSGGSNTQNNGNTVVQITASTPTDLGLGGILDLILGQPNAEVNPNADFPGEWPLSLLVLGANPKLYLDEIVAEPGDIFVIVVATDSPTTARSFMAEIVARPIPPG